MKVDFKRPRYIIPLIILPFLCVFYYIYQTTFSREDKFEEPTAKLNEQISDVSDNVKNKALADKLAAYRELYRKGDGYTAVNQLQEDQVARYRFDEIYNEDEKNKLDSIARKLKDSQFAQKRNRDENPTDPDLDRVMSSLVPRNPPKQATPPVHDPMEMFRRQMEYADSLAKANDPEEKAARLEQERIEKARKEEEDKPVLAVTKFDASAVVFNTVRNQEKGTFIQAIIDENIVGYSDSRLRIRLLDDLMVGNHMVKKGTYLFATVSGFSGQRVLLSISSIMQGNNILPVKLEIYDNDGLKGLFVPASAFREFSRELGGNSTQGISLEQQPGNQSQLVMSVVQRMFQSTSTAVSKYIRKNRAKIKYNTLVYLIDPQSLRDSQKQYK
ncbi:conserved hypothetical protein [Sphingobacterium sp. PM2-P1-29]|nr:conserved hypothetical protein [Sphingobacterium sp. PM2-P1-29]